MLTKCQSSLLVTIVSVVLTSVMVPKELLKKILCIILFVGCLAGCIWIVFEQVSKYLQKTTLVTSSFEEVPRHDLDIIICNAEGFEDGEAFKSYAVAKEKYLEKALQNNVTLANFYRKLHKLIFSA